MNCVYWYYFKYGYGVLYVFLCLLKKLFTVCVSVY